MIVSCPECHARYRLADDAIPAEGRAMRCASCNHRWFAAGPDAPIEQPLVEPPAPDDEPEPRPERTVLKTLFALTLSAAFTTGAILIQSPRLPPLDLTRVPWLARLIDPPTPPPSPLKASFTVARDPVGERRTVFELTGTLANPTATPEQIPPLEGRLLDGDRIIYRWRIALPATMLPANHSLAFTASAVGDPRDTVVVALLPRP